MCEEEIIDIITEMSNHYEKLFDYNVTEKQEILKRNFRFIF